MKPQQNDLPRLEIVPEHIDFAEEERKILQKWRDKNTFQTSLEFLFNFILKKIF